MCIHRRHRYYLGLVAFLIGLAVVAAFVLPIALTPSMRTRLCSALGQRFDSDVAIAFAAGLVVTAPARLG